MALTHLMSLLLTHVTLWIHRNIFGTSKSRHLDKYNTLSPCLLHAGPLSVTLGIMSLARYIIIIISPLSRQDKNGDMLVYLCPLSVCVAFCLSVCPAYRVMFGATLNVGQRHKRRANINTALVQSIVPVRPA